MQFGMKAVPGMVDDPGWFDKFGSPPVFMAALRQAGVDFIEIPMGEDTDPDLIRQAGRHAADAGLSFSLHPYLHAELAPEIFDQECSTPGLEAMLLLAEELAAETGDYVSMVFHGGVADHEAHYVPYQQAAAAGKAFFAWLAETAEKRFPNVRPLPETQLPHDAADRELVRVGDTWQRCLDLVDCTDLGLCWDFGHSWRAALLGKHSLAPPEDFLHRVRHVHLHDALAGQTGQVLHGDGFRDHLPLGLGEAPWDEYLRLLAERDFDGRILLEINLEQGYASRDEVVELARDSLSKISNVFSKSLRGG